MTASFAVHMSGHVSSSRWRPDRHAVARDRTTARVPVRRPEGRCRAASAPRRPEGACGAGRLATDGRSQAQQRAQFVVTVVSLTPVPEEPSYPQLIVTGSDATSSWGVPLNKWPGQDHGRVAAPALPDLRPAPRLADAAWPYIVVQGRRAARPVPRCPARSPWSQPNADGLVVAHVVPLVEGKRRELDRRDVCPGGPTGQRRAPDPAVKSST